jgi:hypothetical protein
MSETPTRTPQPPDITRRTLTPLGYAICAVIPILIAAAGFTFLHFHYDKEQLVNGTRLHILTSDWKVGDDGATAEETGQLVLGDDRCMRLATADGSQVDLVWPHDYEATVLRNGVTDQLKVYDTDRSIVARSSDHIELGGAMVDVGTYAGLACAPPAGSQVFLVQSEVKIVDAG